MAFEYARSQRAMGSALGWWDIDELVWAHKGDLLSVEERSELIGWLEYGLDVHANIEDPQQFDPHQAQAAADRLVRWYEKLGHPEKAIAAIKKAGVAFEQIAEKANALTATAWLEELSQRYHRAKLLDCAARVDATIKARSDEAEQSMVRQEASIEVDAKEVDQWLDQLVSESLEVTLGRMAVNLMSREVDLCRSF